MALAATATELDAVRADLVSVWAKLDVLEEEFRDMRTDLDAVVEERKFEALDARAEQQKLERRLAGIEASLAACHEALRAWRFEPQAAAPPKRKRAAEAPKERGGRSKKQRKE